VSTETVTGNTEPAESTVETKKVKSAKRAYVALEPHIAKSPWTWHEFGRLASQNRISNSHGAKTLLALSAARGVVPRPEGGGNQLPSEETILNYWVVQPNDFVFNPMWAIEGGVGVSSIEGAVSTAYRVYELGERLFPRFVHYFLKSDLALLQYRLLVRGVTTFDRSVTREDFESMPVPAPPLSEQQEIADFLDRETNRIDAIIGARLRMIELLAERRQAVITETVTGNTEPAGRKVRKNWKSVRAKYLFMRVKRTPRESDEIVTAFRDGKVTLRSKRRTDGFTNAIQEHGYQGVRKGDFVVHSMDGFAGAIGVSDSEGKMSPVVHCYRPKQDTDSRFYAYLLRHFAEIGFISSLAKGIRERSTSFDSSTFMNLSLLKPSFSAQQQTADFLDRETNRIDAIIGKCRESVALLRERRQALITAAVTGELEVAA
jgi:type I restriction enzyme, S subunit